MTRALIEKWWLMINCNIDNDWKVSERIWNLGVWFEKSSTILKCVSLSCSGKQPKDLVAATKIFETRLSKWRKKEKCWRRSASGSCRNKVTNMWWKENERRGNMG